MNAADQGLGITAFNNPLSDFIRVINTNMIWNYCLSIETAKRMKKNNAGGNIIFINSELFPTELHILLQKADNLV